MYEEIFDFVVSSENFSYTEVRSMPISVRNLYYGKLMKLLEARKEAMKKKRR